MKNQVEEYIVQGYKNNQLSLHNNQLEIINGRRKKSIHIDDIISISTQTAYDKKKYISITVDGTIVWGEHETTFYYPHCENNKAFELVSDVNDIKHRGLCGNTSYEDGKKSISLDGIDKTKLVADIEKVVLYNGLREKTIDLENIKSVGLFDKGKTMPRIEIIQKSVYFKGNVESNFYFKGGKKCAEEAVAFIKRNMANSRY